jgi:Ribbon-helix-helix protein, copG family
MKMLSVRLDDAEFAALSKLSEQLGETRSQVVKRSIAELARQKLRGESPHELAERMGLIGIFDAPADLSVTVAARIKRKLRAESTRRR